MCNVEGSYPVRIIKSQNGEWKFSFTQPKTRRQVGMNGVTA
jgi:hypothetical protein